MSWEDVVSEASRKRAGRGGFDNGICSNMSTKLSNIKGLPLLHRTSAVAESPQLLVADRLRKARLVLGKRNFKLACADSGIAVWARAPDLCC